VQWFLLCYSVIPMKLPYKIDVLIRKKDYLSYIIDEDTKIDKYTETNSFFRVYQSIQRTWFFKRIICYPILFLILFYFSLLLPIFNQNSFQLVISNTINFTMPLITSAAPIVTIPLTLVGIIIPLIIIVTNVVGNRAGLQNINIYIDYLKPLEVFLVSIIFLILSVFAYSLSCNDFIIPFVFIPLLETSLLVKKTIDVVDDKFFYILIEKKIAIELVESIKEEKYVFRLRKKFGDICESLNILLNPLNSSFNYYHPTSPLYSNNSGFIIDINISKLKKFKNELSKPLQYKNQRSKYFVIIVKFVGEYINSRDVLGFVNATERKYFASTMPILELKLNKIFILKKSKKIEDLAESLKILKDLIVNSIDQKQQTQFERLLNINMGFVYYYMEYIRKTNEIKSQAIPGVINSRFVVLISQNFDDILDSAIMIKNKMLGEILFELNNLFERAVSYQDYNITKMIIEIYRYSIYNRSFTAKNNVGVHRSTYYPTQMILFIQEYMSNVNNDDNNLIILFYLIVNVFINFIKDTISNNDFETFKEVQEICFHEVLEVDKELKDEILLHYLAAFSWMIRRIEIDRSDIKTCNIFIKDFFTLFDDLNELLNLLRNSLLGSQNNYDYKLLDLDFWEEEYSTHYAKIIDSDRRYIFLLCIIGMRFINDLNNASVVKLISSITQIIPIERIETISKEILSDKDKWEDLIGEDLEKRKKMFIFIYKKASKLN